MRGNVVYDFFILSKPIFAALSGACVVQNVNSTANCSPRIPDSSGIFWSGQHDELVFPMVHDNRAFWMIVIGQAAG
jgi:hypothetical protein